MMRQPGYKGETKEQLIPKMQEVVEKVSKWAKRWKLELNPSKCEVGFFTSRPHEYRWRPEIYLEGKRLEFNENPKFLGITYDRGLRFGKHTEITINKITQRCRILIKLAGAEWGRDPEDMRTVYYALCESVMMYCAPGWVPFMAKTNLAKLQRAQNKAIRIITGMYRSTPEEWLRLASGIESVASKATKRTVVAVEKSLRLKEDNPRREVAEREIIMREEQM